MLKKMFRMDISDSQTEAMGIGAAYGFNFNSYRVALAEALDVDEVVVFADTTGDADEIGWHLNVVRMNGSGDMHQWVSRDADTDFWLAVARVGMVATLPMPEFWTTVLRSCEQII